MFLNLKCTKLFGSPEDASMIIQICHSAVLSQSTSIVVISGLALGSMLGPVELVLNSVARSARSGARRELSRGPESNYVLKDDDRDLTTPSPLFRHHLLLCSVSVTFTIEFHNSLNGTDIKKNKSKNDVLKRVG